MLNPELDRPVSPALATPSFAQPREPEKGVLYGPMGLRAGWGIALYLIVAALSIVLCFVAVFTATGQMKGLMAERRAMHTARKTAAVTHQVVPQRPLGVLDVGLAEFAESAGVILAAVVLGVLERRRFAVYGLPGTGVGNLLPGAAAGLVTISVLVGLLRAMHLLVFDARLLHGTAMLRYGAGWLLAFVFVGLLEEFMFRGYLQFTLMRGVLRLGERLAPGRARLAAFWIAALTWSVLFGATHLSNVGEDPVGIAAVFVAGLVFSYALWRTGSLWWGIGCHATWDWGQSFLYGVPDSGHLSAGRLFATHATGHVLLSGGTAGPEGSLLVLPVLGLTALAVWLHPQAAQPAVEPSSLPLAGGGDVLMAVP